MTSPRSAKVSCAHPSTFGRRLDGAGGGVPERLGCRFDPAAFQLDVHLREEAPAFLAVVGYGVGGSHLARPIRAA